MIFYTNNLQIFTLHLPKDYLRIFKIELKSNLNQIKLTLSNNSLRKMTLKTQINITIIIVFLIYAAYRYLSANPS